MPTQSCDNSEPSDWENPAVAPELYRTVREAIPPFDASKSDIPVYGRNCRKFPDIEME